MNSSQKNSNDFQGLNNKSREIYMARYMSQFPRESLLKYAKTEDQKEYWYHLKFLNTLTSIFWLDKLGIKDPLINISKVTNQFIDDVIWARVDTYQCLWKLLNAAEKVVEQSSLDSNCRKLFYHKIEELFAVFCEKQSENAFFLCLKPYHNVSNKKRIEVFKDIRKTFNNQHISPQQYNQIKSLSSQYYQNICLRLYLPLLYELSSEIEDNQELLEKLSAFTKASDREAELAVIGLSRKRDSKNFKKFYSYTWSKGEIIRASKSGGVYNLNKNSQQGANRPNQGDHP